MTSLGEFLGALITDVTRARVQADLQALRVAELYRSVPLLDGVPLPRFRLPDVTFDVPIAFDSIETRPGEEQPERPERPSGKILSKAVDEALEVGGISVSGEARDRLLAEIEQATSRRWGFRPGLGEALRSSALIGRDVTDLLSEVEWEPAELTEEADEREAETLRKVSAARFEAQLTNRLHAHTLGSPAAQGGIRIISSASQVRELSEPSVVARMSITLREDALELIEIEWIEGLPRERLVPE